MKIRNQGKVMKKYARVIDLDTMNREEKRCS
jgi:hypothetical protein